MYERQKTPMKKQCSAVTYSQDIGTKDRSIVQLRYDQRTNLMMLLQDFIAYNFLSTRISFSFINVF